MTDKIPGYLKALYEREPVRALFFYTLLIFLFYSPVVFTGKTLQPPLYQPHGVLDGWAGEGRRPVNSFNVDLATPSYYEWPVNKLVGDFYRKGELPLWNPYQGAGIPLAAQYSTRAFFPYQVLEDMSPVWTWDFFILARLLVAGFLTYLFLSALGLSFPSAFLGGMLYMFSGTFVWFINLEQMANTAMMLPLVMYMVELLARKKGSVYIPAASFSFALLLLAGQPEVALYATLLSFSYFIFRVFTLHGYPGFLRPATRFIPAFLLGLGISAPLILPFLELVGVGHHIHTLGGPMGSQALMSWQTIYAIFTPSATVFPSDPEMVEGLTPLVQIDGGFYRFLPINGLWDSLGGYTGVLSVYLAVVGFLLAISANKGRLRGVSLFFIIFATSIILKNIGIRPFIWLGNLPLFDQVWSLRWAGPVWTFAISMAGAIGLEVILRSTTGGKTGTGDPQVPGNISAYFDEKPYMAAVFSFILLFGLYVSLPLLPSVVLVVKRAELFNANMAPFVLPSILGGTIVALLVLTFGFLAVFYLLKNKKGAYAVLALGALELWWAVPRGYGPAWMSFKWVPFLVGLVIVILFLMERRRVAFSAVLVFFAAVLIIDSTSPRGLPEKSDPFDPSRRAPYVEFLKTRPGNYRSVGSYGVLFPNFASSLGIMDLRYVNSITPSTYHDFRTMYLHKDPIQEEPVSSLWFAGRPERCKVDRERIKPGFVCEGFISPVEDDIRERLRAYSLLGVRYIVLPKGHEMADFPLIYEDEVRIYENQAALNRAFVVHEVLKADSYEQAQMIALREGFDPGKTAVIEEEDAPSGIEPVKEMSEAVIKEYGPAKVVVEVDAKEPGVLVLSDLHYPGWRVEVNGEKGSILRVNGLVRGVLVEKGKSVVEFSYLPGSFLVGSGISLLSVVACLFLVAFRRAHSFAEGPDK